MSSSSRHNSPPLLGLNSFPLPSSGSYPSNRNKSSRSRSKHSMTPPSFLFGDDSTPAPYPSASTNGLQISSPERSPGVRSVKPPGTPSPWYGSNLYGRAPTILGDTHTNSRVLLFKCVFPLVLICLCSISCSAAPSRLGLYTREPTSSSTPVYECHS